MRVARLAQMLDSYRCYGPSGLFFDGDDEFNVDEKEKDSGGGGGGGGGGVVLGVGGGGSGGGGFSDHNDDN